MGESLDVFKFLFILLPLHGLIALFGYLNTLVTLNNLNIIKESQDV